MYRRFDVNLPVANGRHSMFLHIHTQHLMAFGGQHGGRWQANVAQAHNDDFLTDALHITLLKRLKRFEQYAPRPDHRRRGYGLATFASILTDCATN